MGLRLQSQNQLLWNRFSFEKLYLKNERGGEAGKITYFLKNSLQDLFQN